MAKIAEDPHVRRAEDNRDLDGVVDDIFGRALLGVEGEIDLAGARRLARRRPLEQGRYEGRHGQAGLFQRPADLDDLLLLHAEQVAAIDGAHVEALEPMFVGKRDHFFERRAYFIANDGQSKTGQGHDRQSTMAPHLWLKSIVRAKETA
ncbi:MAG: hypothetical protein ACXWLB_19430 [Reyranella sp.]